MMKKNDIIISISKETRMVELHEKYTIGNENENLIDRFVFEFTDEFVNGTARIEYIMNKKKYYAMASKEDDTYILPLKSSVLKNGEVQFQLVISTGTDENDVPIFKSKVFKMYVMKSINAEIEQPDEYPQWIEIANTKLNKIDDAIIRAESSSIYATNQGDYAKTQGEFATEQGTYAKEQGDYADEKGNKAQNIANLVENKLNNGDFVPNIAIGNVDTLDTGEDAFVTNTGTSKEPVFNFGLPKGDKGETGDFNFATFEIDFETGELVANKTENLELIQFDLNNDGYMEVVING